MLRAPLDHFRRDLVPTWPAYAQQHDLVLRGAGAQQRTRCTIHGGEHDSLTINVDTGCWQCKACSAAGADVLAYHRALHGFSFIEAARELGAWDELGDGDRPQHQPAKPRSEPMAARSTPGPDEHAAQVRKRALAARLWAASVPITPESPAGQYLLGRCCVLPPPDSDLRWLPDLDLFGFRGPALVGRMSLAADYREARGLHCTWLHEVDGAWRRVERRYLGSKANCVIRLWPDEYVTHGLAVGEGIETSLSLPHTYTPVWSCMDAGNLSALPLLSGIESLLIAADNDPAGAGERAAVACADRWALAGRDVYVILPPGPGTDLNDLARLP